MVVLTVRVDAGTATALRRKAGKRGVNAAVRGLIAAWLSEADDSKAVAVKANDSNRALDDSKPVDSNDAIKADAVNVDSWPDAIKRVAVKRAVELPVEVIPANAVCGAQTRGGMCGRAAVFARGGRYFCAEH